MSDAESSTTPTEAVPKTVIVGQGYVGLPLAMRALEAGHQVVGYDVDRARTDMLAAGRSFIEDITDHDIASALATGRYAPTSDHRDCAGFDHLVITVPTPLREGTPDLSYVEGASADIARYVRPGSVVILESTTYPGTTDELVAPILEEISGLKAGIDFHLGYSPERIDPGNATWTLANTPKVVSGINPDSLAAVDAFYRQVVETTVPVSQMRVAELTKLIENTFRHVNIALANELAVFAADLDIDIWEAIGAASTKPYGFMRFTPGPGVGGHCLPIDPSYLSWQVRRSLGRAFRFVELANDINEHMPDYVVNRIMRLLNDQGVALSRARVMVLGLAYKKNSSDPRESPAIEIVEQLLQLGSTVHVADPHVVEARYIPPGALAVEVTEAEVAEADVVVLVTDHDAFPYEMISSTARSIFDTRSRMTGANVTSL
jgi:UDP-N-acetyl-D-glucosamine dehydrogenase